MKTTKLYIFAFMAMFMLSFSSAWADTAYVKVTAEDGTVSWVEIEGTINGTTIVIYNTESELDGSLDIYNIEGAVDLNEVWARSEGRGIHYQVTRIEDYAFFWCSGLTSITIPSSVTSIGYYAFSGCSGLTSITIPSSVTSIGDYAFSDCSGLTSITIPSSVTSIGNYAFSGCSGLTSITIPSSVTSIGDYAFSGCSGLTSVTIPSSVTHIGACAFEGCNNLQKVNIDDLVAWCRIPFGVYRYTTEGEYVLCNSNPLYYAKHLYLNNELVTNVEIPNGVTTIGDFTFMNAVDIKSVKIPNTVTCIGYGAFSGCSSLTSVTIPPSVTDVEEYAFFGCSNLQDVEINTHTIGPWFSGLSSIQKITLGEQVTNIGSSAFSGCSSLTSVMIPSSVTSIGSSAFSGCSSLTSVMIPSSVTSIGSSAFSGCSSFNSLTIPSSVTSIGSSAFSGCTNLKDITSEITDVFVTGTNAFYGCENATLHVPAGTYVAYSGRADWNRIIHIEEAAEGSQMTLACNTKGSVLVNGKTNLTNKIKDVEVNEEEENTFEFIPNDGCRLEQVTLNGLDVTLSVSNNKLTTMIPAKSQMMVVFSKGNDINGDGNVNISDVVSLVNIILGQ